MNTLFIILGLYWIFTFTILFSTYIQINKDDHYFTKADIINGFIVLLPLSGFLFPYFISIFIVKILKFLESQKDTEIK